MAFNLKYNAETDTLYIKFRDDLKVNRSEDNLEIGVVYDYHDDTLVGIEIINITQSITAGSR